MFRVTYLALEYMNKLTGGRGGVIVNTASVAGTHNALQCSRLKTRPRAPAEAALFAVCVFLAVYLVFKRKNIS